MTELSASDLKDIADKINEGIDEFCVTSLSDKPRTHLGISEIGNECIRETYYKFRWMKFEQYDGRMLRLFKHGHLQEARYINYLEGIGCKVMHHDENGKQFRVSGVMGHYGGSCDGQVITPWVPDKMLLECKTHNTKSFVHYLKDGLHKTKPQHVDQMNGYGQKMELKYGIYFPENKNDSQIEVSVVKLDWQRGAQLELRAREIITATEPPARISDNPSYWKCGYCTFKGICHYGEEPIKNCRSCRMSKPVEDARWYCSRWNDLIPADHIMTGCPGWTPI